MLQQTQTIPSMGVPRSVSPFLDVDTPKKRKTKKTKEVDLFPAVDKKRLPLLFYELREMDNKLRRYMKGKSDPLFKHYTRVVIAINEIERLEMLKLLKEENAQNNRI